MDQVKTSKPRLLWWAVAGLMIMVFVLLFGWLGTDYAANHYDTQMASATKQRHPVAMQASILDFSSLVMVNDAETPAQYAAEQASCKQIGAVDRAAAALATPRLRRSWWLGIFAFESSKYRMARQADSSDTSAPTLATLRSHLDRLTHACGGYVSLTGYYQADYNNNIARQNLVSYTSSSCTDIQHGCLLGGFNATAYHDLMPTQMTADKQSGAYYAKDCPYPELVAYCRSYAQDDAVYEADHQLYYEAMARNDFNTEADLVHRDSAKQVADDNAALSKAEPAITRVCQTTYDPTQDCGIPVVVGLMKQDEQALQVVAKKLLSIK